MFAISAVLNIHKVSCHCPAYWLVVKLDIISQGAGALTVLSYTPLAFRGVAAAIVVELATVPSCPGVQANKLQYCISFIKYTINTLSP